MFLWAEKYNIRISLQSNLCTLDPDNGKLFLRRVMKYLRKIRKLSRLTL